MTKFLGQLVCDFEVHALSLQEIELAKECFNIRILWDKLIGKENDSFCYIFLHENDKFVKFHGKFQPTVRVIECW